MKKIFLKCYYEKNLGDDLFIDMITKRYPNKKFYLINYLNGHIINKNKNLRIYKINNNIYRFFQKMARKNKKMPIIDKLIVAKTDLVVTIGGSLFMESKNYAKNKCLPIVDWHKDLNKDYLIVGANVGPIYTNEYLQNIKDNVILNAKDVCLRDNTSYQYFKNMSNVRMAPDIIFSYDYRDKNIKEEKKVIFSIIDIDKKKSQIPNPNKTKYEKILCELVNLFLEKGYIVEFMSFCKFEGDEKTIKSIIQKNNWEQKIKMYFYNGDIELAMDEIASAKIIVGTRFHANVIGMCMNKTVVPIIYNDKTKNLLKDINFKGKFIDINNIDDFDVSSITDNDLNYKIDVSIQKKEAEKHFEKLDLILKENSNE